VGDAKGGRDMSIEVKVDLSGLEALIAKLPGAIDAAAVAMAEDVKERADKEVPVDTGALKRSGRVEKRGKGEAAVVYGDEAAPYAAAVHDGHREKSQFLRTPAMEAARLRKVAAATLKRDLGL